MTISLRPHHLLCMLTYVGKGYSPAFVANYDRLAARIGEGEEIRIIAGPDDVCQPFLETGEAHCLEPDVFERDRSAAASLTAQLGLQIGEGMSMRLDAGLLRQMREAFAAGSVRSACAGCQWTALCDGVAQGDFRDTRLACLR